MQNIDELINFIKRNHINLNLIPSDDNYMEIKADGDAYAALAQAFPECLPHNEDYNDDVNGHFDLSKTRLHVENQNGSDK